MQDAAKEVRIKKGDENAVTDTGITNDGAWQRRGHSSLNGFVATTSVETGKILDGEVMSRKCKSCEQYKKIESTHPIVYESWISHISVVATIKDQLQTWSLPGH